MGGGGGGAYKVAVYGMTSSYESEQSFGSLR